MSRPFHSGRLSLSIGLVFSLKMFHLVTGLVHARDAIPSAVVPSKARHRAIANEKPHDAIEPERVRKHDVDRQPVCEDDDAGRWGSALNSRAERGKNACPEGRWIGAEIADRVRKKASPGVAAFRAKR